MKICVTGSSGRAGRAVVADLTEHGHEVIGVDLAAPRDGAPGAFLRADLTDYGQAVEALAGADAVIHMANCCWSRSSPGSATSREQSRSTG